MNEEPGMWRGRHPLLWIGVSAGALLAAGFVFAYQFVGPAPPSEITIAAGPKDGAYYRYAERYRAILAADRIQLHVRETRGSTDNLKLLRDPESGVDLAFLQSGTAEDEADSLVSLASVAYEPLWIFLRGKPPQKLVELEGKRLAIGYEGSGTRLAVHRILSEVGIDSPPTELLALGGSEAAVALEKDEVDVAFFVAAVEAPFIQDLLRVDGLRLVSLDRSPAYARRQRNLASVTLLQGVIDIEKNTPPEDVRLLAPLAILVARSDFHPALVDLVLGAAGRVHGTPGIFEDQSEFPSARYVDLPLSEEAARFLERGPSFLNRFLPFWAANFVDRMFILLIPILTLLIPLFKVAPAVYRWRVRSRFKRWYRDLQKIDIALGATGDGVDYRATLERLEAIQEELGKITVPPAYGDELYHMRFHVSLVRERARSQLRDEAEVKTP